MNTGRLFDVPDTRRDQRDRTLRNEANQSTLFDAPTSPTSQACPVCASTEHTGRFGCSHGTAPTLLESDTPTPAAPADHSPCQYGAKPGHLALEPHCDKRATHRAEATKGDHHATIDCCRSHADYYASAWVPASYVTHPLTGTEGPDQAAWITIL